MKRRKFLTRTVGTAIGGISLNAMAESEMPEEVRLMTTPAALMAPRGDGMEIVWGVSRLCRGWVEWQADDGSVGKAAADAFGFVPQSDGVLKVRVRGLNQGTTYRWRAIVESAEAPAARQETAWKPYRTLDPTAAATQFVVWNDTHENQETLRLLHQRSPTADFMVWNGDTCNDWHQESQLIPTLLSPGGQDISDGRPLFLTMGNHDVRGKYAFKVPQITAVPAPRPFYGFRSGPVAVLCLHTGEDKPDDHPSFAGRVAFQPMREAQAEWIREMAARPEFRDAPYKVVFCHIPLRWIEEPEQVDYAGTGYDRYARSSRDLWHDALVAWGAQVVISGHTHRPAWIPADETFPYAQLIGGGPQPQSAHWIEGHADSSGLKLILRTLEGKPVREEVLPPLA